MGKKIWLFMHSRIFGSHQIIRKYVYITEGYKRLGRNFAFQALACFSGKSHGHPDF